MYLAYCIVIILLAFLGDKKRGGNTFIRFLACLCFVSFVGLRKYTVGVDSATYGGLFYEIPHQDYVWMEIGFDSLIRYLYGMGFDYTSLFLTCIIFTAIPTFLFLENLKSFTLPAILIYIVGLLSVCNGMRQNIAVGIFMLASLFIIKRKLIPYIICISVALLFHSSSAILYPLYFIVNKNLPNRTYTILYILSFVFCFINMDGIIIELASRLSVLGLSYGESFSDFTNPDMSVFGLLYVSFINASTFFLMIKTNSFKRHTVFSNLAFASMVLKNISFSMVLVGRIMMYFDWFIYILYPMIINDLPISKQLKKIIAFAFIVIYFIGFVKNIINPEMRMLPYLFYFE